MKKLFVVLCTLSLLLAATTGCGKEEFITLSISDYLDEVEHAAQNYYSTHTEGKFEDLTFTLLNTFEESGSEEHTFLPDSSATETVTEERPFTKKHQQDFTITVKTTDTKTELLILRKEKITHEGYITNRNSLLVNGDYEYNHYDTFYLGYSDKKGYVYKQTSLEKNGDETNTDVKYYSVCDENVYLNAMDTALGRINSQLFYNTLLWFVDSPENFLVSVPLYTLERTGDTVRLVLRRICSISRVKPTEVSQDPPKAMNLS